MTKAIHYSVQLNVWRFLDSAQRASRSNGPNDYDDYLMKEQKGSEISV